LVASFPTNTDPVSATAAAVAAATVVSPTAISSLLAVGFGWFFLSFSLFNMLNLQLLAGQPCQSSNGSRPNEETEKLKRDNKLDIE
jgi:hypothetical protein